MHQPNSGRPLVLLSFALIALVAHLGGCVVPGSVVCSDGRTCPSGTRCNDQLGLCVTEPQMVACEGKDDRVACEVAHAPGLCRGGVCEIFYCGDGKRVGGEACDGDDLNDKTCTTLGFYTATTGLRCNKDCTFDTSGCADACGDKKLDVGKELCDGADLGGADCRTAGFYEAPGLQCSPFCTLDVSHCKGSCGDEIINGPEQCDGKPPTGKTCFDYGFDRGSLGCSSLCGPQVEGCAQIGWRTVLSKDYPVIAVWGSSANDVFAVGWGGTIVRGSGTSWTKMDSGTKADLWGVWGSSPDHVFAVGGGSGGGVILLWDGVTWTSLIAPTSNNRASMLFSSVWGSGPDDVFVMNRGSDPNVVVHWDGKTWSELPPLPETQTYTETLWGSGPNDLYAIGDGISRWDGTKWTQSWRPAEWVSLQAIWGSGPRDIFAVALGMVVHWDGNQWKKTSFDSLWISGVWGTGPKDVFAIGSDDEQHAKLMHWNGTAWSWVGLLDDVRLVRLTFGIWGSSSDDIYIAGAGGLRHSNGDSWSTTPVPGYTLDSLWAAGPDDLFALGPDPSPPATLCPPECPEPHSTIFRFTGMRSSKTNVLSPFADFALRRDPGRLWGSSSTDLFAAFPGVIQHWDGVSWSLSYAPDPEGANSIYPWGVWGSGPNNVYAVGITGVPAGTGACSGFARWNGTTWSTMPLSITAFCMNAVWVSSQGEVFAVGERGSIVHSDGTTWSVMSSGSMADLSSVWGSGPRDVYAAGEGGTILHFDGTSWRSMTSGTTVSLTVTGSGAGDVFAFGGVLLHLRGETWETIAMPPDTPATALWVTPSRLFVVGGKGGGTEQVLLHLDRNGVTCAGPEKNCRDGWDNDCDGLADGVDPDCAGKAPEQCANLVDDDANGKIDCDDPGCATFPSCRNRK